ncbi:hypothetical protein JCM3770_003778 [Rhodotorula araucariae]
MDALDLKPLHGLYQLLHSAGDADLDHPLVCLAQLYRRPAPARASPDPSRLGEVEWVVALGSKAPAPSQKGKKRKAGGMVDVWWEARLCGREVDELLQQVDGSALMPRQMIPKVRERWIEGKLEVSGFKEGDEPRGGVELIIRITPTLPLSIILTPCDEAPFSLMSILADTIQPFLTASQDRVTAANAKKQLEALRIEHDKVCKLLDNERDDRKRARRVPGTQLRQYSGDSNSGAPFGRRKSSQDQSQSQSQGQGFSPGFGVPKGVSPTEEREMSISPSKVIPGVTRRGVLKPGDPGYAGSSHRVGRVVEEVPWDEDPPSDD